MSTLLTFMQSVCDELGLDRPSSVVGSTNKTTRQLLALLEQDVAEEVKSRILWPQLIKLHEVTLVEDQEGYEFPDDIERQITETQWNQSETWAMVGPISPQRWQLRKFGIVETGVRDYWRVRGAGDKQFLISPVPSASQAGNTISFEYVSKNWVRPKSWSASATFPAGSYCWNDGNIYQTTSGGNTGNTAPTHTTGSSSDGSVTWDYISTAYEKALADTDTFILPETILRLGLKYRWKQTKGFPFSKDEQRFETELKRQATKLRGARTVNMGRRRRRRPIGYYNIPDTGYGL